MKSPLLLAVAIFSSTGVAAQHTIDITSGDPVSPATSTAPDRTVENLENGVRVTYTFSYARLDSIPSDSGNGSFIVSFDGFGISEIPGHPALPSKLDAIEVPSAEQAVLTIETIDYSDYFFEIAPAMPPELDSTVSETTAAPISVPTGFFPARQVEIVSSQSHYDKEICFISLSPVAYDHARKSVRIANKIVYTVSFGDDFAAVSGPKKARGANPDNSTVYDDPVYSNIVLNAPASSSTPNFGEITQDYLILTTSECENAVKKFADWKRAFGFRTHVSILPTGDDVRSDAIVKDSIEIYTKKYGRSLKYLLIVGDTTAIQSYKRIRAHSTEAPHLSDFYFGCTTDRNFKYIPDLHRGRIPAKTNTEAQNAFDKIMAYERCENYSSNFFKNGLHCAFYENKKDHPRYDTRRFVCTSEEILESARSIGLSPTRIYSANTLSGPPIFYAHNTTYETNGEQMSDEITLDFNWNGNTSDIKSFLENPDGVSYVLYRGHGDPPGWENPKYHYPDILKENYNQSLLSTRRSKMFPVIFSITCSTGQFEWTDCFASHSILGNQRGSSCIIAASAVSFSGFNDAFVLGMFDAFYPKPILSSYITHRDSSKIYKPVYRIGEIMDQGLYQMAKKKFQFDPDENFINHTIYTYEVFHCFGDPSMMIWCQEPTKFENAKIDLDTNSLVCNVTTGGEPAYISFYDRNANNVKCYYGTEASFKFSQIHYNIFTDEPYEYVVISAPNKIPTIKSRWLNRIPLICKIEHLFFDSSNVIRIVYTCGETDDIQFIVTSVATGKSRIIQQPKGESEAIIDLSDEASGTYVITMVVNGNKVDSSTISIN